MMTENYANPSSLHYRGMLAEQELEKARKAVAKQLFAQTEEIIFTSGGTEANNLALFGTAYAKKRRGTKIVTTSVEHSSIMESCKRLEQEGFEIAYVSPRQDGVVHTEDILAEVNDNTVLVSVMYVNNETGAIMPVAEIFDAVKGKKSDIICHTDAVQAYAQIPINVDEYNIDMLSVSGHKFGLVYPGLGWVCWKGKEYLPEEMSFSVNYLGANITQVGLNFSRPAAQILGQYYQFIRLGFQGYKEVQYNSLTIAKYIHDEIGKMAPFVNYSDDVVNPLFIWYMKPEYAKNAKWTLYDLQAKLQQSGWMVPAYTLPENIQNYVVMRVVVRQGFSRDMADMLLNDIKNAICEFEKLEYPTPTRIAQDKNIAVKGTVFTHNAHSNAAKK